MSEGSEEREIGALFGIAIEAEEAAAELYRCLAARFEYAPAVAAVWAGMAADEMRHAEELRALFDTMTPEQRALPMSARILADAERRLALSPKKQLALVRDLEDAYELARTLEGSEINSVLGFLVSLFAPADQKHHLLTSLIRDHVSRLNALAELAPTEGERRKMPVRF